ncbi:N-acetyl-gamma-glutamyl-phosphate reductase [Pseudomonas aeruginosa]|nr:N-acetyl-gamma-glutamyl-phosphate reductase [Pseudomonas aeruginosa]
MIKVGIVGGTGYTGVELLRLLAQHPQARVEVITSRSEAGVKVADMYPNLRGHYDDLQFSVPDVQRLGACDVVFFATPHGVAHALAGELLDAGTRVIDLSADFRLADAEEWGALVRPAAWRSGAARRGCLRPAGSEPREDPPGPPDRRAGLLPDRDPTGPDPAAGGRPGRRLAADRRLQVRGQRRRSGRQGWLAVLRGGRKHDGLRGQGASASPGNQPGPASGLRRRRRADVRTAPDANDPRYPCNPLCPCRGSLGRPPGAVREALRRRTLRRRDAGRQPSGDPQRAWRQCLPNRRCIAPRAATWWWCCR